MTRPFSCLYKKGVLLLKTHRSVRFRKSTVCFSSSRSDPYSRAACPWSSTLSFVVDLLSIKSRQTNDSPSADSSQMEAGRVLIVASVTIVASWVDSNGPFIAGESLARSAR